jgi:hypothetical protein
MPALDAAAFFCGLGEVMRNGKPDNDALTFFGRKWQLEFLDRHFGPDAVRGLPSLKIA